MNIALWLVQGLLALVFVGQAVMKFTMPEGLPAQMAWLYDIPSLPNFGIGVLELLIAVGLILPGVTRIRPGLVVWAAAGYMATMVGAAIFHIAREEFSLVPLNAVLFALAAFVAYGRRSAVRSTPSSG